jgi:hypothetical protein
MRKMLLIGALTMVACSNPTDNSCFTYPDGTKCCQSCEYFPDGTVDCNGGCRPPFTPTPGARPSHSFPDTPTATETPTPTQSSLVP